MIWRWQDAQDLTFDFGTSDLRRHAACNFSVVRRRLRRASAANNDISSRSSHPSRRENLGKSEFRHSRPASPFLASRLLPRLLVLGLGIRIIPVEAQWFPPTPAPFLGNCAKDIRPCCEDLVIQAEEACYEYESLGFTAESCYTWKELAWTSCVENCANCSQIAFDINRQCRFALGILGNGNLIERYCKGTQERFEKYRCPSVCEPLHVDRFQTTCFSENGTDCMYRCGNYYNCNCRSQPTTLRGDICFGKPYDSGYIPWRDTKINFTCDTVTPECMHHIPEGHNYTSDPPGCAKYRKCTPDYCLIKRTKCVRPSQCMDDGTCIKETGKCEYYPRPKGSNCSDGINYTVNDSCDNGDCIGITDYCLKYNVKCKPLNPTCTTGGVCHPHSGRCTYDNLPDGTKCDDGRAYTVEDRCQAGLCVGMYVDLCVDFGTVCTAPSACYSPGICDPKTGKCSEPVAKSGDAPCDDGDYLTVNDTCIDGICLGRLDMGLDGPKFLTMGKGDCTDRDGRRMATYSGDVVDELECQDICVNDPQCAAYAYAYPLCTIYGTIRTQAPMVKGVRWSFAFASDPPGVVIEKATMLFNGQKQMYCRKRGTVGDIVDPDSQIPLDVEDFYNLTNLGLFFGGVALIFFIPVCIWSTYRCCCHDFRDEEDPLEDGTVVYKNPLEALADGGPEAFLRIIEVVPYGVVGWQVTKKGKEVRGAPEPTPETVIVDPVTLDAVQNHGPDATRAFDALGQAAAETKRVRTWLGLAKMEEFPIPVRETVTVELVAKLVSRVAYNGKRAIHVASPDMRNRTFKMLSRERRVHQLGAAYAEVLAEFAASDEVQNLRLAPILFGATEADEYVQELTADAVAAGFGLLPAELQLRLIAAPSIEFCVVNELDFPGYAGAFARRAAGELAPDTAPPKLKPRLSDIDMDLPALPSLVHERTATPSALAAPPAHEAIDDAPRPPDTSAEEPAVPPPGVPPT